MPDVGRRRHRATDAGVPERNALSGGAWLGAVVPIVPTQAGGGGVSRMECHTTRVPGWPSPRSQNTTLTTAIRLVRMYGNRVPTVEALRSDFGVSRATAYRWRAAFIEAQEQSEEAA